jgi:cytochrome c
MTKRPAARASVGFFAAMLLAACQSPPSPGANEVESQGWPGVVAYGDPGAIAEGKGIAQRQCASCHAIERMGSSPNRDAPPLRDVLAMNDPDRLAYRFIEAMRIGHDAMPLFDFDVRTADSLIAYIASISKAP